MVLSHDVDAYLVDECEQGEVPNLKTIEGGGGTAFVKVIEKAAEYEPDVFVGLTDLFGSFPEEPEFPCVWASTGKDTAPFGRCRDDRWLILQALSVWVIDTGHAWLAVPISHAKSLGVSPGGESRVDIDNQVIFLERTHDAGEFLSCTLRDFITVRVFLNKLKNIRHLSGHY